MQILLVLLLLLLLWPLLMLGTVLYSPVLFIYSRFLLAVLQQCVSKKKIKTALVAIIDDIKKSNNENNNCISNN